MNPFRISMLCAALSACAASPQWEKPGATAATAQQDSDQCRAKARLEAPLPSAFAQTGRTDRVLTFEEERTQNELVYFQKCMQDRGYSAKR
jgi:hypothetical protein